MPKVKEYKDDIFWLEMPEGGDIDDIRAVGFTGWQGTLERKPRHTVRFYAKVIGFEDTRAPMRNWQTKTKQFVVDKKNALEDFLGRML